MAALSQGTRRKLSLLQLAEEESRQRLQTCRIMDYHRDTFYEVHRAFQVGGLAGLVEEKRGPKGPHPNPVSEEVEEKILTYRLEHPTHGQQRVANELRLQSIDVSPPGVRGVWMRHGLETRHRRLLRLEQHVQKETFVLSQNRSSCWNATPSTSAAATWRAASPVSS